MSIIKNKYYIGQELYTLRGSRFIVVRIENVFDGDIKYVCEIGSTNFEWDLWDTPEAERAELIKIKEKELEELRNEKL